MEQYGYEPPASDPFAAPPGAFSPFMSLSARGARPSVSMLDALMLWIKNWRNFSGRASQSEYWWVYLAQFVAGTFGLVLFFLAVQFDTSTGGDPLTALVFEGAALVAILLGLVTWVPTLSLTVRRLHDVNHSGWFYLVTLLPFGSYVLLFTLIKGSDPAGYQYDDSTQPLYGPDDLE